MKRFLHSHWAVITFFIALTVIYFRKFFFEQLLPIPSDIIAGVYYPWRDYAWGYSVAVPVKNALPSDIVSFIYPFRVLAIDLLKQGIFPLWNPYVLSGTALFANFQTALLYPTTLLYFIFSNPLAWSVSVILQVLLSLICMYFFLYDVTRSKLASIVGAIVFSFSAFSTVWLEYNTHGHTAYWLPLLLLIIRKFLRTQKPTYLFLIAWAFALQLFAGYPQIVLYSLFVIGTYLVYNYFESENKSRIATKYFLLGLAFGIGILIASIQLLPGYEFLQSSNRFFDPTILASNGGFLPYQNLVTFFIPDFFGSPVTLNFWGKGFYDNFAGYAGIATLIFTLFAFYNRNRKLVLYFYFLLIISLLLAFKTPVSLTLSDLNILGFKAAVASRAIFIADFTLSVLAAIGFAWLLQQRKDAIGFRSLFRPILYVGAGLASVIVSLLIIRYLYIKNSVTDQLVNVMTALRNSTIPLFFFITACIVFAMYYKLKNLRFILSLLLMLVLILDLFRFGNKYLSFTPKHILFPATSSIDFVREQAGVDRINGGDVMPMSFWVPYGLYGANGYDANYALRYAQFLSVIKGGDGTNALGRYGEVVDYESQLFDLVGIKYVFALKWTPEQEVRPHGDIRPHFKNEKFKKVFEDKSVAVLENTKAFPRVFLVNDFKVAEENIAAATLLNDQTLNLQRTVVLEQNLPDSLSQATGSAEVVKYKPNEVTVKTTTNGSMLLFLSDTFLPGWQVTVDGAASEIYRANFAFRSVVVPEGEHEATFLYKPRSVVTGAYISAASATISIGMLLAYLLWKRKNSRV